MSLRSITASIFVLMLALLLGCGGSGRSGDSAGNDNQSSADPAATAEVPEAASETGASDRNIFRGFDELPEDRPLPGEQLNSEGEVIPSTAGDRGGMMNIDPVSGEPLDARTTSQDDVPSGTRFASGALTVDGSAANAVVDNEGLELKADPGQNIETGYAAYRLNAPNDPALITTDINLPDGAEYYIALADYGAGKWRWKGPFTDGRLRFNPDNPGDLVSGSGNAFVAITTTSTTALEVAGVGLGLTQGSTTPSAPVNLSATPAAGGVLLDWDGVGNTSDLAGYKVYRSSTSFSSPDRAFSAGEGLIAGRSDAFIETDTDSQLHFRVSAVHTSGNESGLSGEATATPGSGSNPSGQLEVSRVAGQVGAMVDLDASSINADSYDWDTDGDGDFEETGVTDATKQNIRLTANNGDPAPGLLRPAVRAKNADGEVTLFASASVLFPSNVRPQVTLVELSPSSGSAPLNGVNATVNFNDPDGEVTDVIWDTDGDGGLEQSTRTQNSSGVSSPLNLSNPISFSDDGLVQVSVRVTDNDDDTAWGHAFVDIERNLPPNIGNVTAVPGEGYSGITEISLSATNAVDPDGDNSQLEYAFDPNGDGVLSSFGGSDSTTGVLQGVGNVPLRVRVRDSEGLTSDKTELVQGYGFSRGEGPRNDNFDAGTTGQDIWIDKASARTIEGRPALVYRRGNFDCAISVADEPTGSGAWKHQFITSNPDESCDGVTFGDSSTPSIAHYVNFNAPTADEIRFSLSGSTDGLGGPGNWSSHTILQMADGTAISDTDSIELTFNNGSYILAAVENDELMIGVSSGVPSGPGDWSTYGLSISPVGDISMDLVDQQNTTKPAIAYYHEGDQSLNWVVADSAVPGGSVNWSSPVTIDDSSSNVGFEVSNNTNISCTFDPTGGFNCSGVPMVAYLDAANSNLKLAASPNNSLGDAAGDWNTQIVDGDEGGNVGDSPELVQASRSCSPLLTLVDTFACPNIFYVDNDTGEVNLAQSTTVQPGNWSIGSVGDFRGSMNRNRATVVDGFPTVFTAEADNLTFQEDYFSYLRPLN